MNIQIPPQLINVLVIVLPTPDKTGNAAEGQYSVTLLPEIVKVTAPNTIINYQIIPPTAEDIVFKRLSEELGSLDQLGTCAVSYDGKMLTVVDANTANLDGNTMHVYLRFGHRGREFRYDPQIQNTPEP